MKILIAVSLLLSSVPAMARGGFFTSSAVFDLDCQDLAVFDGDNQFECRSDEDLAVVKRAVVGPYLASNSRIRSEWDGAVEFGVLKDYWGQGLGRQSLEHLDLHAGGEVPSGNSRIEIFLRTSK